MADDRGDSPMGRGGAKSDPQSPLMFTPSNGNSPVMQENRGVDYEKLGREVDDQIKKLESMGGPGVSQPFMSATGGGETLAGDTYQKNKVEGDPANDLKRKQKKNTLFDDYIFNRDVLQPTPPAMLGERVSAGGARRRAPSIPGFSTAPSPPTLLWGRGEGNVTQLATPSAWSLGEGATGVDKTLPGMKTAFRPIREEDEVRFKTPHDSHSSREQGKKRYRAFINSDVPSFYPAPPFARADGDERSMRTIKFSPETSHRDFWVEDNQEGRPKRVCRTPRSEEWAARGGAQQSAGNPAHSTELRHPAATRWGREELVEAQEADAAREPYVPPPIRLLRQEEGRGETLRNRTEGGTRPFNDRPDPESGSGPYAILADTIMALNESVADVRDTLRLSCEYFTALQQETARARPVAREAAREEPREEPPLEIAPPRPVRVEVPSGASPEPRQNRKRFDYKKVPPFDSNKMEWRDFLGIFEMAARWNEWTEAQKAQQLAMSMTGSAQKYVLRLPAATVDSYTELIAAITRRYDPEEREVATLADFQNRKRQDKESVEDFGQALQSLAGKAFPDTDEKALERMVVFQFTAGMGEEDLRKHIHFGRAKTMDKAISLAVEWESYSNKDKKTEDTPVKPKVASVEVNPLANQMEVLLARLDKMGEEWRNRPRLDRARLMCYGCGQMGHFRRECPTNPGRQPGQQGAPVQGGAPAQVAPAQQGQFQRFAPTQQNQGGQQPAGASSQPAPARSGQYPSGTQGPVGPAVTGPYAPNASAPAFQPAQRPSAPPVGPNGAQGAPRGN